MRAHQVLALLPLAPLAARAPRSGSACRTDDRHAGLPNVMWITSTACGVFEAPLDRRVGLDLHSGRAPGTRSVWDGTCRRSPGSRFAALRYRNRPARSGASMAPSTPTRSRAGVRMDHGQPRTCPTGFLNQILVVRGAFGRSYGFVEEAPGQRRRSAIAGGRRCGIFQINAPQ